MGGPALGIARPMHITRGADRRFYGAEHLEDRGAVIDATGTLVGRIFGAGGSASGELDAPGGTAVLGDAVFVADFYNHRVQAFRTGGVSVIGGPGLGPLESLRAPPVLALQPRASPRKAISLLTLYLGTGPRLGSSHGRSHAIPLDLEETR